MILPAPSKGCQMVPKGCQFTIRQGLIGTPWKVLVELHCFLNPLQALDNSITWKGPKLPSMEDPGKDLFTMGTPPFTKP